MAWRSHTWHASSGMFMVLFTVRLPCRSRAAGGRAEMLACSHDPCKHVGRNKGVGVLFLYWHRSWHASCGSYWGVPVHARKPQYMFAIVGVTTFGRNDPVSQLSQPQFCLRHSFVGAAQMTCLARCAVLFWKPRPRHDYSFPHHHDGQLEPDYVLQYIWLRRL